MTDRYVPTSKALLMKSSRSVVSAKPRRIRGDRSSARARTFLMSTSLKEGATPAAGAGRIMRPHG